MMNFIESNAGRIAARIQNIGVGFDPEIVSLPGGSVIAVLLWLYSGTVTTLKRGASRERPAIESVPAAARVVPAAAACVGCPGHG